MNTHFSLPFRQNLDQQMPNMRALIQISEFSQRENHDFENWAVFGQMQSVYHSSNSIASISKFEV